MNTMVDRLTRVLLAGALISAAAILVLLAIVAISIAVFFALEPYWGAAFAALAGAGFILFTAIMALLLARALGRRKLQTGAPVSNADLTSMAAEIGQSAATLLQSNARSATMVALGAGMLLGLSPQLRRKLRGLRR